MRDFLKEKNIGPMLLIVVLLLALSAGSAAYNGAFSAQHSSEEKAATFCIFFGLEVCNRSTPVILIYILKEKRRLCLEKLIQT